MLSTAQVTESQTRLKRLEQLTHEHVRNFEILVEVVDELPVGVIVCNGEGDFLVWNKAAHAMLGQPGYESTPSEWPDLYKVYASEEDARAGRLMDWDDLPLVRALQGERFIMQTIYVNGKYLMANSARLDNNLCVLCLWEPGRCADACARVSQQTRTCNG